MKKNQLIASKFIHINMKKFHSTALIGTGYWGSLIFNTLTKVTKNKIYIYDINKQNSKLLKNKNIGPGPWGCPKKKSMFVDVH